MLTAALLRVVKTAEKNDHQKENRFSKCNPKEYYSDYKGTIPLMTWMALKNMPSERRQTSESMSWVIAFM